MIIKSFKGYINDLFNRVVFIANDTFGQYSFIYHRAEKCFIVHIVFNNRLDSCMSILKSNTISAIS
ncbi:Uncharacterised protein [Klebsiella pneumoniae]|nr:hypothetical protein BLK93_21065 [Klebsiella pneumoniae]STV51653.1 Uncharacterised protein [Klebsiella pneumoniae]SVN93404.1 Uncharacterised protein [Klebsiella pneumoniae]